MEQEKKTKATSLKKGEMRMLSQTQWVGYYEIKTRLLSQGSKKVMKLIKLRKKRKANEASQSIMLLQGPRAGGWARPLAAGTTATEALKQNWKKENRNTRQNIDMQRQSIEIQRQSIIYKYRI